MRLYLFLVPLLVVLSLMWSATALSADDAAVSADSSAMSVNSAAASTDTAGQSDQTATDGNTGLPAGAEEPESENIYEVQASIGFSLEYNDNINETSDNKVSDIITHIKPSFHFTRVGGRLQADIDYRGDYLFYLKDKDTEEYRHYLVASVTGEVVENLFFFSMKEDMQQVYRDVSRGEVMDDETLNDLVNRNRFTVSPYFTLHPSDRTELTLGYDFTDLRYSKGVSGENPDPLSFNADQYDFNYKKSQSHTGYVQLSHELTDRALFFTGGSVTRWIDDNSETEQDQSLTRYIAYLGGSYQFSEDLAASIKAGPSYSISDENSGDSQLKPFVEAELTYTIGRNTFGAFYTTSFEDNPSTGGTTRWDEYKLEWTKEFDRSRLTASISYNVYENEMGEDSSYNNEDSSYNNKGNTFRPAIRYTYDLTDRLSSFFAYSANIYEDHQDGSHIHYGSYGLRYELSPSSTAGVSHMIRYTEPYKDDSFYTNRIMFEFTHRF